MPVDSPRTLRILQVSTHDIGGGAEKVAWNLFNAYRERKHASWLVVGFKHSNDPHVIEIPRKRQEHLCRLFDGRLASLQGRFHGAEQLCNWLRVLARGRSGIEVKLGRENFNYPGSHKLLELSSHAPNIVHCHNLHGGYFDLRCLPQLSHEVPIILTLHDAWLLSGHCAHSFDCERWRTGCGHCPDLTIYPSIRRDATTYNWRRKQRIYQRSSLYVATPCHWLRQRVDQSILANNLVEARVIPNGVDLNVFHPVNKQCARAKLGLPPDIPVLLFTANSIQKNIWKDYQTMQAAVTIVAEQLNGHHLLFIALGEEAPAKHIGQAEIRFVPHQKDSNIIAQYYQAADCYVHASKIDTFPNTVLEALATGTPVVATAVGGIPEQIEDGYTGFLVPISQSKPMADRIMTILADTDLRDRMGKLAANVAREKFDLKRQVKDYLSWYHEIIDRHSNAKN